MNKARFLWVDDEIDLLKPYILFLQEKGYATECASSGQEALERCRTQAYDIIFLDEHMPGLSGLETLTRLHRFTPHTPVVMVTKSEDEGIMNQAIGKKIADYLIKPVHPHQVLSSIKKLLDKQELVARTAAERYRASLVAMQQKIDQADTADRWIEVYKELIDGQLELDATRHPFREMASTQLAEANRGFARFIQRNYEEWMMGEERPLMSHDLFSERLFPLLDQQQKVFFILIDNFRYDQWRGIKDAVAPLFHLREELYYSILPTATPYARNSIFGGLTPVELAERFPRLWVDEGAEEGKNREEEELLAAHLQRKERRVSFTYHKINSSQEGEKVLARFSELQDKDLNILVFNFMDMLSHARTESLMLKELVADEAAYRSLTRSWFLRSPLEGLLRKIAEKGHRAILTTDHGSIRVKNGIQVVGDKATNPNPRYKLGRSLAYDPKKVFAVVNPRNAGLPAPTLSTRYIFARGDDFLAYPNGFHRSAALYQDSFQHGGISLQEMVVPFITLTPKK